MVSSQLICNDCLVAMREMADNSVDSIVTDPPYGLSFMGKQWDYDVPSVEIWKEALRVLKPGGHLLAFAGSRTYHRLAVNVEDAGFEIRDQIMWIYGSGFPKSLNISKAIDKAEGVESEVIGIGRSGSPETHLTSYNMSTGGSSEMGGEYDITKATSPKAKEWEGWGTALKPAHEPVVVARKPIDGTVIENVLEHGTGGINIDGCRIGAEGGTSRIDGSNAGKERNKLHGGNFGVQDIGKGRFPANVIMDKEAGEILDEQAPNVGNMMSATRKTTTSGGTGNSWSTSSKNEGDSNGVFDGLGGASRFFYQPKQGRFPSNVILDEEAGEALDEQSGHLKSGDMDSIAKGGQFNTYGVQQERHTFQIGDEGGASRFFYCAKPSGKEKEAGLDNFEAQNVSDREDTSKDGANNPRNRGGILRKNTHPTVKPVDLMRYLCRLVTPPNGITLDPFMGSGTTGIAANLEGFSFIGIEMDENYVKIARARIAHSGEYEITEDLTMKRIKQPSLLDFLGGSE
jgi:DNA modification methylase|tara:strand:+ start:292 stop:1833 length:1542 start_codon:yes stop_codon:yes gene_type:complete